MFRVASDRKSRHPAPDRELHRPTQAAASGHAGCRSDCKHFGDLQHVQRLLPAGQVPVSLGDRPCLVAGGEDKGDVPLLKDLGQGIDHLTAQVDVEDRGVRRRTGLQQIQGALNVRHGPENLDAGALQFGFELLGYHVVVLDKEETPARRAEMDAASVMRTSVA
jgi:hypothetical protein